MAQTIVDTRPAIDHWPRTRGDGIFGTSQVHAAHLWSGQEGAAFQLHGKRRTDRGLASAQVMCPCGAVIKIERIERFDLDATEVDGIAASKSSDRSFESIQAFGDDFVTGKGAPIDASGLEAMLAWREVRIKKDGNGSDRLQLNLWDGRLFLINAGGSHHFAGASYIARQAKISAPLCAPLGIVSLRHSAIRWLLERFHVLAVATHPGSFVDQVAKVAGSCFAIQVTTHIHEGAELLFVPREAAQSSDVVDLFIEAGAHDIGPWFEALLSAQIQNAEAATRRFGARLPRSALALDG